MPGIAIGNCIPFNRGGVSWSTYWTTREPSALILTVVSDVRIDATWTDSAETGADGYKVYISTDNATWTLDDTVAVGAQASSITGLTQATIYYVKVVAYKGANESTGVSDFQLTLASAFVGGVANTKRYIAYDLDTVTKDVNNYVTVLADKYGSGVDFTLPAPARLPLWTSDGIKILNYAGLVSSIGATFTINQTYEIYVSMLLPTFTANTRVIMDGPNDYPIIRQGVSANTIAGGARYLIIGPNFPLNEFHVAYLINKSAFNQGVIGVDGSSVNGFFDVRNASGIMLGGSASGYGLANSIFREVVVRDVESSADDRAGIIRYLMNVNAFFF